MVSRRLWIPDEELKADRVAQAQKMLGDAFKGVRDAAGSAMSQVGDTVKEDRLGWAQKQMEQAFSPLRQAPMPAAPPPMEMPEPEPPAPAPVEPSTPSTLSTPSQPTSRDASPAAPSMPSMVSTLPTPGVDLPNDGGDSGEFGGSPTAVEPPKSPPVLGGIGNAFDALGTKVNDMGFRAPGQDGKGVLGNTGLGEAVRGADQWSQANTPTPKSLSADDGLFGRQGPLQKALDPDVGNDPNLAGLKLGLETTGYPAMAKGAVRTGGDWLKSLDTLGTGLDKVTGRDRTLKERGQGALETGMGAIGAVAPQFTYIGNVAAERAKEQGMTDEQAETVGAVVGFLTPGGGTEQLGKAGAYLNRAQPLTRAGRLGGAAETFARTTGNLAETPEQLAKLGRLRSLAPAAAMGVAAPIGGVLGAREAAERDGAGAGDIALGALGGATRAADLTGGIGEMGVGAAQGLVRGARRLPEVPGRFAAGLSALRDGQSPGVGLLDGVDGGDGRDGATSVDGRALRLDAAGATLGGVAGGLKGDEYDEEDTGLTRAGRVVGGALGGAVAGSLARRGAQDVGRIGRALAGDETGALRLGITDGESRMPEVPRVREMEAMPEKPVRRSGYASMMVDGKKVELIKEDTRTEGYKDVGWRAYVDGEPMTDFPQPTMKSALNMAKATLAAKTPVTTETPEAPAAPAPMLPDRTKEHNWGPFGGDNPLRYAGGDLSKLTDRVYSQQGDLDEIEQVLPGGRILNDDRAFDLWAATTRDLALGQEHNKNGLLLEFGTDGLRGHVNTDKPGWEFTYDQGNAEVVINPTHVTNTTLKNNLRSVTVPAGGLPTNPRVRPSADRAQKVRTQATLDRLEGQGWSKTTNPDGSVTYRAPTPDATPTAVDTVNTVDTEVGTPKAQAEVEAEAPLNRGEEMAAAAEATAAPGGRRSAGEIRTEALTAENVVNPEGGVGRGATNPEVRATGPDSPGNLPKIRQNVGVPAGGPHPPDWDEATMGTRPTSEFEDTRVPIPSIEALKAREIPLTMADAQAIMSRQAAKVRRDGQALEQLRKAVPDHPALAYLTEGWTEERIALPYRQQGVRELAEANARRAGPVAEGLATNVKRETNRVARRNANVAARDQADREVIAAAGARGAEGTEGTDGATAVDDAMADAEAAKTPEEAEAAANKVVEAVRTEAPEVTRTAENTDLDGNPVPPRKPPPKTPRTPKAPTPPTPTTTVTTTPTPPKAEDGWWLDDKGDLKVLSELEKDKRADADLEHAEWNKLQARLKTTTDQTEHAKYVLEYKTALGDRFTARVAALSGLPQADILTLSIDPGPTGERVRGFMDQARAAQGVGANPDYMLTDNMGNVARANLIGANPVTMLRNAMGGASSLILHPLEAAFAAPISQATEAVYRSKGLDDRLEKRYGKEAAYLFKGYGKALPAAITNFAEAMKRGNQYQARGYAEELEWRRRNPKASFSRFLRQGTDKLLAPLTATDAFFRTLTQGGELFRQTYRTMKDAGADDATISRDIVKLLQAPRAEFVKHYGETQATGLSKGVQKEMDYRAFTQELDAPGRAIQGFQKIPVVGNLIMPFVTTPYNAAKFDLERSPVGAIKSVMDVAFAKRGDPLSNLKTLHTEMSKTPTSGEMAERLSRGFIGSAAFATLLGGTMSGVLDINGSLPDSQRERDEWEAEGRRPYSIAIGDRYVSFQELPGLNAPLIQAAIIKDILNGYGGEDKDVGMAVVRGILETVRSLATQPMAGGAMSALGAINNPGRVPESIIQGMAGPILPGSGLSRVVTTANDPFQREQAIGPLETLERIYNPQNLPIRRDAVGNGMENWNAGLAALNPLRTNANTGFRPPTKYILSDKASTDVATDRAVKRVSDWKKDPINYPMPDGSDFIAADMAKGTTNEFGEYLRSQERTRLEAQNLRRKTNPLTGA